MHHVVDAMLREEGLPYIGLQLLDTERKTPMFRFDSEHHGPHFVALLHDFGGMLDALGPAHIADMDQTVDAVFDFNKSAKFRQVADAPLDDAAGRVALR